jgi:regulator of sigma E protease
MFTTLLTFLLVLAILVLVHEFGHFIVAKKSGMKVEEFGVGFPPKLWSFRGKDGVEYSVNAIPLGGFVRIKGESGHDRSESDSFSAKPAWKRFLVLIAGVTMNMILAAVLLSIGYMVGMPTAVDGELPAGARVSDQRVEIFAVAQDSAAAAAGVPTGTLVGIDGHVFTTAADARTYIADHGEEGVRLDVQTEDETRSFAVTSAELPSANGTRGLGVALGTTGTVSLPPHRAVLEGTLLTGWYTKEIVTAFGGLIKNLIVRQEVSVDLSGPVGIAVMTGKVAAQGIAHLLQFMAVLSINLAVINALPFPALDGGRILFLIIEKLRGRPATATMELLVHNIGFALLMILVVLVTFSDIMKYGSGLFAG